MEYKNFEEYLIDQHAKQYTGLDDEMGENFEEWLDQLSPDEWIIFGNKYKGE